MSIIKLAVYGAIGYFVYQTFFADMPAKNAAGGEQGGGQQSPGGGEAKPRRRQTAEPTRMTGGGEGRVEKTQEATGGSVPHRVGRGVL